jgi:xylulokinase
MSTTLGIDLGTSSIKVARFDAAGEMIALASRPFHEPTEHDVPFDRIWDVLTEAVREVTSSGQDIAAVGLSSQTNSFALIDARNLPCTPVHLWTGDWAGDEAGYLADRFSSSQLAEATGMTQLTGRVLVPKCLHLKNKHASLWSQKASIQLLPDMVIQRLSGKAVTDASLWSLTGLYNIERRTWWAPALEMLDIDSDQLPRLSWAGGTAGQLTNAAAERLMLPAGIPVAVGALDHLAAAVGVGNVLPGCVSLSTGTASCVVATHGCRPPAIQGGTLGPHPANPDLWYALSWSGLSSAGLVWYSQQAGKPIAELGNAARKADGWQAKPRDPSNSSAGFTFHDTTSQKRNRPTEAQAVGAILDCLTDEVEQLLRRAACKTDIERLIAIGGGAQSDHWLKMIANRVKVPVVRPNCVEAAAAGAARFAAKAAGRIESLAANLPEANAIFEP